MQILVLYFSKGGNTRKLAEAILKGVESVDGVNGVLKHTDDVTKEDFVSSSGILENGIKLGQRVAKLATKLGD
jgi:NAD(P)H dehydrogenase (quinone)